MKRSRKTPFAYALVATLLGTAMPGHAASLESHSRIQSTAKAYIANKHPWQKFESRISVDALDPRSRLASCPIALQAFLPPGAKIKRRTTVGVRCKAGKPWKIYLPVTVSAYAKVMVAKHAIAPNSAIRKSDISWVKRDISSLGYGYLNSMSENGYKSRRSIAQGAVLTPNMVTAASIVSKGQRVNLRSKNGVVQVSMQGQALENAALGERIRVKNLSSGKQIEGIVESPHEVLIY